MFSVTSVKLLKAVHFPAISPCPPGGRWVLPWASHPRFKAGLSDHSRLASLSSPRWLAQPLHSPNNNLNFFLKNHPPFFFFFLQFLFNQLILGPDLVPGLVQCPLLALSPLVCLFIDSLLTEGSWPPSHLHEMWSPLWGCLQTYKTIYWETGRKY